MIPLSDLSRLDQDLRHRIASGISGVLESGWFLRGTVTDRLERRLSDWIGIQNVVTVGNGTDALVLALLSLGVGPGSRVATMANAGGYTTGAALRLGAQPVFVDVDVLDAQMHPASLEHLLDSSSPPDVVVMTHLYGQVGPIDEIVALCSDSGVPLIEDCAQAFGARANGRFAGTFGQVGTTSFYPTKNLGAMGDGGAVLTQSDELASKVSSLAQYGWKERFHVEEVGGLNSRLDEVQAVVLDVLLDSLAERNARRREICSRYAASLTEHRRLIGSLDERFIGHLAVVVTESRDRDRSLLEDASIQTGVHYPVPDHLQVGWQSALETRELPRTEWLTRRVLTIPCFPELTEAEVDLICAALESL